MAKASTRVAKPLPVYQTPTPSGSGVALLSGAAFGEFGEGYVRLSYANSQENINKALERLDRFVRSAT